MGQVKELHLCKNLNDLEQYFKIPSITNKSKMKSLIESAQKLLQKGDKHYQEGDEEYAYVYYMRYFNLLNTLRKMPTYTEYKVYIQKALGGNTANTIIMDKLEEMTRSLSERYDRLNEKKSIPTPLTDDDMKFYNNLSASDKFNVVKASPSYEQIGDALKLISCKQLFHLIQANTVLIMDCRSVDDYKVSRLSYNFSFNVPEEIILPGLSAGKLQDKLDNESKKLWSARSIKDQVVLMDWNCREATPNKSKSIAVLQDILQNWDPDCIYRSPIKIVDGGYEFFIMMYPTLCTNPTVQSPQHNQQNNDMIDDIEYPSIHDITMKDDVRPFSRSPLNFNFANSVVSTNQERPFIDRSSKTAALKTYNEKQKAIVEIMKEHDELVEKAQANDEQLEQAQQKWNTVTNINKLTTAEQQLLYNIWQLESAAEDYRIENNRLRDELENYKRLDRETEKAPAIENEKLEEVTKKIETKIQERQKVDEQHEREKKQRETQLAIARENKRHMKPPVLEDEEMSQPKIPQFDRSVKPIINNSVAETIHKEKKRDFSPISGAMGRGLTGLKNLGNTCYMNSVLQCLSNTPQLTEYCITNQYKNYINRSNKTKGHIVEEVAALIKVLWNGNYKCVASKDLRYVIGQYQQIFRGIEQQDSHEFLTILMDWLHSDLQTLDVPEKSHDNLSASDKAWSEFTKSKESVISRLFYGQIKSTVKCIECNKESATYESFSNLSFELPTNNNDNFCSLEQCMAMYFNGEVITGWNCPNCKQQRRAIKKLDISKLPPVLVIHLKRFYADPDALGNSYKKKQIFVKFPLDNLDMRPHIAKSELRISSPKTYQLYGVSNHYGSMESGHYTAFCKSNTYGKWFKFDDQVVSALDASSVNSSAAYILFYSWLPTLKN